jgi:hypothetical protein
LNLSIMDDLNMRNFESLALNQVMVTNRVSDHAKIDLDYSNTVFFDRFDQKSFAEAMEVAWEKAKSPNRTIDSVINKHMQIHRYVEMFNCELGTELVVPDIDVEAVLHKVSQEQQEKNSNIFVFSAEQGDILYDEQELGVKAVYSYVVTGKVAQALFTMTHLLDRKPDLQHWEMNIGDLLPILDLCIKNTSVDYKAKLLVGTLLEAILRATEKHITTSILKALSNMLLGEDMKFGSMTEILKARVVFALRQIAKQLLAQKQVQETAECLNRIQALGGVLDTDFYLLAAEVNRLLHKPEAAMDCYEKAVKG